MAVAMESICLEAALDYGARGWRVVPVAAGAKNPWIDDWQNKASSDSKVIEAWWEQQPGSNVGVRLGEVSGIIDIECDDAAAEVKLAQLFHGVEIVTATFEGKRGKHRLFKWTAELPFPMKPWFKIGALEFRTGNAKGAQSVFPPSIHPDGKKYRWLVHPEDSGIADLPDHVIARLWNWVDGDPEAESEGKARRPKEHWERILKGASEGSRNDDIVSLIGKVVTGLADLDDEITLQANLQMLVAFDQQQNNPPLGEAEIRKKFLAIVRKDSARRVADATKELLPAHIEDKATGAMKARLPDGLRLKRVDGDPPAFELYAPQFSQAERGCIVLTAEQLANGNQIKIEANKQAKYPLSTTFVKAWGKDGGLYEQLIFNQEIIEAPPEQKRQAVIADRILEKVNQCSLLKDEGAVPNKNGSRFSDGSFAIAFNVLLEHLKFTPDEIKRQELSRMLQSVETKEIGKNHLKHISREGIRRLEQIARGIGGEGTTP